MKRIVVLLIWIAMGFGAGLNAGELTLEPASYLPIKSLSDGPVNKFFVKYNIPDSLNDKLVVLAFLELETDIDTSITDLTTIDVYPLAEEWSGSSLPEVRTSISKNDTLISYAHQKPDSEEKLKFDITELVMRWAEGTADNNGLVVMLRNSDGHSFDVKRSGENMLVDLRIFYEKMPTGGPE